MDIVDFIRVQLLFGRQEGFRPVEMNDFIRLGRHRHDRPQWMPSRRGETDLLGEFALGAYQGRFSRLHRSGRYFPYAAANGIAELPYQDDPALIRHRDDGGRTGVTDDIQGRINAIGKGDAVAVEGKHPSFMDNR